MLREASLFYYASLPGLTCDSGHQAPSPCGCSHLPQQHLTLSLLILRLLGPTVQSGTSETTMWLSTQAPESPFSPVLFSYWRPDLRLILPRHHSFCDFKPITSCPSRETSPCLLRQGSITAITQRFPDYNDRSTVRSRVQVGFQSAGRGCCSTEPFEDFRWQKHAVSKVTGHQGFRSLEGERTHGEPALSSQRPWPRNHTYLFFSVYWQTSHKSMQRTGGLRKPLPATTPKYGSRTGILVYSCLCHTQHLCLGYY